jgi:hypothetical protein
MLENCLYCQNMELNKDIMNYYYYYYCTMLGGYSISSDHQSYNVTPMKTPFGLLVPLLQSQSHVTTITIISYAVTRLHNYTPYTFVTTITYYTLALADFSAVSYCLILSHTLHLRTSKLSPRTYSANSLLKTST